MRERDILRLRLYIYDGTSQTHCHIRFQLMNSEDSTTRSDQMQQSTSISRCEMAAAFILVIALATVVDGDVTGSVPDDGSCLCLNNNSVDILSSACGQEVIGSANSGECFKYTRSNTFCSLNNINHQFFQVDYDGNDGWAAGTHLDLESDSRCDSPAVSPTRNGNEYTCQVADQGRRVHESSSHTPYDCVDRSCKNTCKGGQCVAYVKCRCKKNGKYPPATGAWRPGQKLKTAAGKCNRNIAPYTAIATFPSGGRYYGHAAVFIKCIGDYKVQVYDQGCGHSVGYSTFDRSHRFFSSFATIMSSSDGPSSFRCRSEPAGPTTCPTSVPGCKSTFKLM